MIIQIQRDQRPVILCLIYIIEPALNGIAYSRYADMQIYNRILKCIRVKFPADVIDYQRRAVDNRVADVKCVIGRHRIGKLHAARPQILIREVKLFPTA